MNIPAVIELLSGGEKRAELGTDEIKGAFPDTDAYFVERDWDKACRYLAKFTDDSGICRLPLDTELDGNTLDYFKNMAVFMIFTGLMKSGKMGLLPPQTSMQSMPYIYSRMAVSEINVRKFKRMDDFVIRANRELRSAADGLRSIDDIFESIFSYIPSVENFASVGEPDTDRYLPFFEMLLDRSRTCADTEYSEVIGKYIRAMKKIAKKSDKKS